MIFGTASKYPANGKLTNGYRLFEWTMRKQNVPRFWMRGITGENCVTTEEMEFLKSNGCRTALVYDDLTERIVSRNGAVPEAQRAIEALRKLRVPSFSNKALFVRFGSDWSMNHNWMLSFAYILRENGYVPGFMGNTDSSKRFCFDRECGHFYHASKAIGGYGAIFGATEPKNAFEPENWSPYCPSDFKQSDMLLWETGGMVVCGDVCADAVYARDDTVLSYFY